MATKSGVFWVTQFPGSVLVSDLEDSFRPKVNAFIAAAHQAGAATTVVATYRPPERAYLMHWSWRIVKQNFDAHIVPAKAGVDIDWWHDTQEASVAAATGMVNGFAIAGLNTPPALQSRHTEHKAIDLAITWAGDLTINKHDNTAATISSTPRNSSNAALIIVGASYGVIHLTNAAADINHWSTDGH